MAAGEADSRGSAEASPAHESPQSRHNSAMLSPRAAAFSVEALLTGQEETEDTRSSPSVKANTSEAAAAKEVSEVTKDSQSAAEGALDGASRIVDSPSCETGNGKDRSPRDSDDNTDDEDLLVDVEDCSCEFTFNEEKREGGGGGICAL